MAFGIINMGENKKTLDKK